MDGLQYSINFTGNAAQVLAHVNGLVGQSVTTANKAKTAFADTWKSILAVNGVVDGLNSFKQSLQAINAPGIALNKNLQELKAITGVSTQGLKDIEAAARASAKTFGTDASQNVESYKILLSKLNPEIGKNSQAMKAMGDNVNVLSKSMGGDTVAAAGVLTTAMNQYGVSTEDPIEASKVMAKMMNEMGAAAQLGSAELPQIGQALESVGLTAKSVGLSFTETNAAIQYLDKAGARGAEGGTALRNVLLGMQGSSSASAGVLEKFGISIQKMRDPAISLSDKLKMLKPVMGDVSAMAKLFGEPYIGAGKALVQAAEGVGTFNTAIQGTTSAQDQAATVMDSYEERMKRSKAAIDDYKIGWFNLTESIQPYLNISMEVITEIGKVGQGITALSSVFKLNSIAKVWNTTVTYASNVANKAMLATQMIGAIAMELFTGKIKLATAASLLYSNVLKAAMGPIGWIILAVGAAAAAYSYYSDNTAKQTREQILNNDITKRANEIASDTITQVQLCKNVIDNENTTLAQKKEAYDKLIKINPDFIKTLNLDKEGHLQGAEAIGLYIGKLKEKAEAQAQNELLVQKFKNKNDLESSFQQQLKTETGYDIDLDFLSKSSKKREEIIESVNGLSGGNKAMKIAGLLNKSINEYTGLNGDIQNLTSKIGAKAKADEASATAAATELANETPGQKKARLKQEKEKKEKEEEAVRLAATGDVKTSTTNTGGTKGLGKTAGKAARESSSNNSSGGGGGSRTIHSLVVNKLVETLTIHTTNIVETKEQIRKHVGEALLTAVNDFSLSLAE